MIIPHPPYILTPHRPEFHLSHCYAYVFRAIGLTMGVDLGLRRVLGITGG